MGAEYTYSSRNNLVTLLWNANAFLRPEDPPPVPAPAPADGDAPTPNPADAEPRSRKPSRAVAVAPRPLSPVGRALTDLRAASVEQLLPNVGISHCTGNDCGAG